ncbi:hypothetical protein VFPPC_17927 [Pochonia chlamydosporia 170]|uniref:Uncharacterized protein n=1 Tax=Pochonia chlamydosporia 170 TaxID=1380566 RepID=A0A219APZ3_METCM|nr:hypothetical protein VFPPC_17927 [Pochonia chlamydosporia 170]OWT42880.1 hypothetical protein VFPPC_17927 [Pochonia chlamydosporia 170]
MSFPVFLIESVGFPPKPPRHRGRNVTSQRRLHLPEKDPLFLGKKRLGWVAAGNMERVGGICKSNPAPEKQFEGAKKISTYPVRRCQEWTTETIELLKSHGVLVDEGADDVWTES